MYIINYAASVVFFQFFLWKEYSAFFSHDDILKASPPFINHLNKSSGMTPGHHRAEERGTRDIHLTLHTQKPAGKISFGISHFLDLTIPKIEQ